MNRISRLIRRITALFLVVYGCALHIGPAAAGLVPSQTSGATAIASARDADLVIVRRALEHRMVAQKLKDYGVEPGNVELRLANLSDADVHTLASASKGLPTGADGLGTLVTVLIIVLLVIVILKLLNKEIVVK